MDIHQHMEILRSLLPDLRSGKIEAIEFGDPKMPMGFLSHHSIQYINTPAGKQITFKLINRHMYGSGHYMGNATDHEIEIEATKMLALYLRPLENKRLEAFMKDKGHNKDKLLYFPVKDAMANVKPIIHHIRLQGRATVNL